jgi:hypothetical protein
MASTVPDAIESETNKDKSEIREAWCLQIYPSYEAEDLGPSGPILTSNDAKYFERKGIFEYISLPLEKRTPLFFKRQEIERRDWQSKCDLRDIILI